MAASHIGFVLPVIAVLGIVLVLTQMILPLYLRGQLPGKRLEALTGLWTLTLYLMLGIVQLWLS